MALYDVTHTCGHETSIEMTGPFKQRNWRLAQMRAEPCLSCRRAEAAAQGKRLPLSFNSRAGFEAVARAIQAERSRNHDD